MEIKCTVEEWKELIKKEPRDNEAQIEKLLIQNLAANLCLERILFYAVEQMYPGALPGSRFETPKARYHTSAFACCYGLSAI